jgi:hypothetical protein
MEVEDKDATFESLRDSGAFPSLDTKLGAAIIRDIAPGRWVGRSRRAE